MSSDKCIVCSEVMFGNDNTCSDCDKQMCVGCTYIDNINSKDRTILCTTCFNQREENSVNDNPYQQAFESMANYRHTLNCEIDSYTLTIFDTYNDISFQEKSSDFFTLMQYFYKWERGNENHKSGE